MSQRVLLSYSVLSLALVTGGVLAGVVSCSGPDPGAYTFTERPHAGETPGGGGTSTSPGGTTTAPAGTDGGTATPAGDVVFGTTTFAAGTPGRGAPAKAANDAHQGDCSGKDCITCHSGDWAFAGTLYTDATKTARVTGAEVRLTGPDGKTLATTFSDADGNFWIDPQIVPSVPIGSHVGVRNATSKMNMAGAVAEGQRGCNQAGTCHGGTQGGVYLK